MDLPREQVFGHGPVVPLVREAGRPVGHGVDQHRIAAFDLCAERPVEIVPGQHRGEAGQAVAQIGDELVDRGLRGKLRLGDAGDVAAVRH